jgi:tetratricopeptide (TPR) repeat protein
MSLPPQTQLGRYEIRSLIGAGGMGEVYLAHDTSLNRKVALKVLPTKVATNQDRMRRFKQEATSAASLNHPNIAHIYEIGEAEGLNYIAMEYVEGTTLRTKITLDLDPNFPTARYFLGRAYEAKGMYDQAVEEYSKSVLMGRGSPEEVQKMKDAYAKSGWKAYVQMNLDRLVDQSQRTPVPPFVIATMYARLGRKEEAIAWLEKGYEERDFRMTLISVSFEFDSMRSDPRFKELVRRLGLPE